MNRISKWQKTKATLAFTLIELLAVIAIIGLLSALVVGLSGIAGTKSRQARARTEHGKLVTAIEAYKAELGNYPPDNPDTNKWRDLHERAGRSPLFYELSGAVYSNGMFITLNKTETVTAGALASELGVSGVQNSSRQKGEVPYRGVSFKRDQYAELNVANAGEDVEILVAPIRGPYDNKFEVRVPNPTPGPGPAPTKKVNPWFYDTTTTNRHNPESFDLWTEYVAGGRTNVIGNWKE